MWLVVPFTVLHPHVEVMSTTPSHWWSGDMPTKYIGRWADLVLALVLGGVPRQVGSQSHFISEDLARQFFNISRGVQKFPYRRGWVEFFFLR